MSSLDQRLTSLALSLFQALEESSKTRVRVLAVAGGILVTGGMWLVHLSYPYILHSVIEADSKITLLCLFAVVLAPPFAASFSVVSLIWPQANEPVKDESGPMSGYFYRERADRKWKIIIASGIIAAINLLLMMVTSDSL